jgi:short-subunit dehydrogenase
MKDKVVIITGGSSGIGRACAEVFGKAGAKIVISGRNKENLSIAQLDLKNKGVEVHGVISDVSLEEENEKLIQETLKQYGKIDILINNAGISMRALFADTDVAVIKKVMDINFYGAVYATKYALPHILKSKGSIVAMSSIAGYRGLPGRTGYSASKFAMQGFFESLRTELLKKQVHILTACPGFTTSNIRTNSLAEDGGIKGETSMDENKMMSAEKVAEAILSAVIKRKRDLILTNQGKMTVFFNKWIPSFMDKIVYNHMAKEKGSLLK